MPKVGRGKQLTLSWVPIQAGDRIPANAVEADDDELGNILIGRVAHEGEIVPGRVDPYRGAIYIPSKGLEHKYVEFEVLVDTRLPMTSASYYWKPGSANTLIPRNALVGGMTSRGEPLFVARSQIKGDWVVGKVEKNCGFFPFNGYQNRLAHYEVLVLDI